MMESTCLRVSQLAALWYASAKAFKYRWSECASWSTPSAVLIADDEVKLCHRLPAFSEETVFKTADTISVALLVWRCLVFSLESLQLSHGFPPSGSSLHASRNSLSFSRGSFVVAGAPLSLYVDAVLAVSGERKVSLAIFSWPNVSAISSTEFSLSLLSGDDNLSP